MLKAYELRGANDHESTDLSIDRSIWACTCSLADLDLAAPEALSIIHKLESVPSALQFLQDNPIEFIMSWGWGTAATGCWLFDRVFGKDEGGRNQLSQESMSAALLDLLQKVLW